MSDPVLSGEPSEASAATAGPASTAASSGTPAPIGSFGTAKGSGLSRGKRPSAPAASAASPAAPAGYQPSALEVIRPASEYKNPFTGETSVPVPASPEPAERAAPEPVAQAHPEPVERVANEPVSQAAPLPSVASAKEGAPVVTEAPAVAADAAAKAELNILPTEEVKRPAMSWGESAPAHHGDNRGRRDERPTFRPERRDGRPTEGREPRREHHGDRPRDFAREEQPAATESQPKSGGFIAWLKGLFGGKSAAPEAPSEGHPEHGHDGHHRHRRRRHRGGRGRGGFRGENRGPQDQQAHGHREEGGEHHGEHPHHGEHRHEGGGRRRHRGGRGRHRGDRGGPHPEGQQGGGAI